MKSVKMAMTGTVMVAAVALGLAAASAQGKPPGVVTSLQGTANVQRVSAAQPQLLPLKFRDEVQFQDRITTGDQSLVRILLGGKAVVTVREHSSLTITSGTGQETIDITAGKIALAVAKERMSGDQITIKTPNAIAGVRGTVVITEVLQSTASLAEQGGGVNTKFTLLTGIVDVTLLNPNGQPGATRFTMNPLQTLSITGFTPPSSGPRNITPQQGQAAANDYKVGLKDAPQPANSQITDKQVEQASNAAAATGGGSGSNLGSGTSIVNKTNNNTGGSSNTVFPGDHLPASCTNNCVAPPSIKPPPPPPECRTICEGRGAPALTAARRR